MEERGVRMKRATVVMLGAAAIACSSQPERPPVSDATRELFAGRCASCHGENAAAARQPGGAVTSVFTNPDWQRAKSDEDLRRAIRTGAGAMPANPDLSDAVVDELIAIVRSFAP